MSNHEVITLSQGETMTYNGGNVVENIIFDCTADDCALRIVPSGDDWTMRNVGVKGTFDRGSGINTHRNTGDGFAELIANDEASGGNTITIEHCYFGDGCEPGVDKSFMTSSGSHGGHMEIIDSYFAKWNTSALYIAGAARSDEAGGTFAVRRCYLHDNNIASVRIATDGSIVEDCVIYNDHEVPWATFFKSLNEGTDLNQIAGRGIWSSYGDAGQTVDVVNCEIDCRGSVTCPADYDWNIDTCFGEAINGSDSSFHVQGGNVQGSITGNVTTDNVGSDPDLTPPPSVPMSAEEAVGQPSTPTDTLTVIGSVEESMEYTIEFTGDHAEYGPSANTSDSDPLRDTLTDNGDGTYTIHGYVSGGEDEYYIHEEGTITSIDAPPEVEFEMNGETRTRAELLGVAPITSPQNFGTDEVTGETILASWDEPQSTGTGVLRYTTFLDDGEYETHEPDDLDVEYTGLDPNTEYTIGVFAVDEGGVESDGVYQSVTTEAQASIEPPANLDAHSIHTDGFSLDWDVPPQTGAGVDEYVVYLDETEYGRFDTTGAEVLGLDDTTEYTVGVTAIDAEGEESDPATTQVTTLEPGSIGSPRNIRTNLIGKTSFDVLWDAPDETGDGGIDHYTVYVDGTPHDTTPDPNYSLSNLDPGTSYVIDVTTTDVQGNESNAATIQESTFSDQTIPPNPVTNLTVDEKTSSSASFSFNEPDESGSSDLDHYIVYENRTEDITIDAGTTTFTLYGLHSDTTYTVGVSAVNEDGEESLVEEILFDTESTSDNHGGTPVDPDAPGCGFGDIFDDGNLL